MAAQESKRTLYRFTFGETVYRSRLLQRFTQKELADALEVPVYKISRIERGITVPTDKGFLQKVSEALSIPYGEIERLAFSSRKPIGFEKQYPNIFSIIYNAIFMLSNCMPEFFLDRIERRLSEFGESEASVSLNLSHFLQGMLNLSELPANGTRPLSHYFMEWNRDMDEWSEPEKDMKGGKSLAETFFRQLELKRRVRKKKTVTSSVQ